MVTGGVMREILLHGGSEEIFDHSVLFAKRIDLAIVQASTSGGSGMAGGARAPRSWTVRCAGAPVDRFQRGMIPTELLVSAYASGWFPMAVESGEIRWYSPDPRGIIPLDAFHVPSRLSRVVRAGRFRIEVDRDFDAIIRACAEADRQDGEPGTWIDEEIIQSYGALHRAGLAHSIEAWQDGRLAGGLYGVALGGAFFGESMFHRVTDASKVALVALDRSPARRAATSCSICSGSRRTWNSSEPSRFHDAPI